MLAESAPVRVRVARDVELAVEVDGPENADLVVLLHGFPDTRRSWSHLREPLLAAGFRVAAADLRGFGASDVPRGVVRYRRRAALADLDRLVRSVGGGRGASVVGHDWGGGIAWWNAEVAPAWLVSTVVCNAPHPDALRWRVLRDREQRQRSAYAIRFQVPFLPEARLRRDDHEALIGALQDGGEAVYTAGELDQLRERYRTSRVPTGMLNLYRAWGRSLRRPPAPGSIRSPLLLLWGTADGAFGPDLMRSSVHLGTAVELVELPGGGHFVHRTSAARVNEAVVTFLEEAHGG